MIGSVVHVVVVKSRSPYEQVAVERIFRRKAMTIAAIVVDTIVYLEKIGHVMTTALVALEVAGEAQECLIPTTITARVEI
jgi:hypothetical protein